MSMCSGHGAVLGLFLLGPISPDRSWFPIREWLAAPAIDHMLKCHSGMPVQHTGPSIAHHCANPHSHVRFVAVDRALGAGCLSTLERTVLETLLGIVPQRLTVGTQTVTGSMLALAKDADHGLYCSEFSGDSGMLVDHVLILQESGSVLISASVLPPRP
jgi:hypothetical protein